MIKFGIIGAGGIAKKFARDIKLSTNSTLVAIGARTKAKMEEYKAYYKVEFAYSSYLDLAKSSVIDAVYIATPHSFHYEQAIMFLKHKKHVLVGKRQTVHI